MDPRTRRRLAATCVIVLLAAGCSDDSDDPAGAQASGDPTAATASEPATPSPSAAAGGEVTLSTLTGEATRLSLDQAVVDSLGAVGLSVTAVDGGQTETAGGTTTFAFPVTGGQATINPTGADPFDGSVEHQGGLRLSALGRDVTVDGLVLDGEQDRLTAMVAGRRVPLLPLVTDPQVTQEGDAVVIAYSAAALDTSAVEAVTSQLGLPTLPDLTVNSLEATLTGS